MSDPTVPAVALAYGADLSELSHKELEVQAGARGVDFAGLRSNRALIDAITEHDAGDAGGVHEVDDDDRETQYRIGAHALTRALIVHYTPAGSEDPDLLVPFELTAEWQPLPDGLTPSELRDIARPLGLTVENDTEV